MDSLFHFQTSHPLPLVHHNLAAITNTTLKLLLICCLFPKLYQTALQDPEPHLQMNTSSPSWLCCTCFKHSRFKTEIFLLQNVLFRPLSWKKVLPTTQMPKSETWHIKTYIYLALFKGESNIIWWS